VRELKQSVVDRASISGSQGGGNAFAPLWRAVNWNFEFLLFTETRYWNSHKNVFLALQSRVETLFAWGEKRSHYLWQIYSGKCVANVNESAQCYRTLWQNTVWLTIFLWHSISGFFSSRGDSKSLAQWLAVVHACQYYNSAWVMEPQTYTYIF